MKKNILKGLFFSFILLSDLMLYAVPGDDTEAGDLEGNDAPIDSKLVILAIAGILFAVYAFRNNKKTV